MKKILTFILTISLFSGVICSENNKEFMMKKSSAVLASTGIGLVSGVATGLLTYAYLHYFEKFKGLLNSRSEKEVKSLRIAISAMIGSAVGLGSGLLAYYGRFRALTPEDKIEKAEWIARVRLGNGRDSERGFIGGGGSWKRIDFTEEEKNAILKKNKTDQDKKIVQAFIYRNSRGSTSPLTVLGDKVGYMKHNVEKAKNLIKRAKDFYPKVKVDKELEKYLEAAQNYVGILHEDIFMDRQKEYAAEICGCKKQEFNNIKKQLESIEKKLEELKSKKTI